MVQRTDQQRKAIEVFCKRLAETLNDAGYDMLCILTFKRNAALIKLLEQAKTLIDQIIFKLQGREMRVPWTQDSAKDNLWRPIQIAMFGKRSTTELEVSEVSEVHETLMKNLTERYNIPYVEFPSEV